MMNADDLNYALKKFGWTQVALSRALQVDICTVNNVIHGRTTSRRIAGFIALQLNTTIEQLWPERYRSEFPENPSAMQVHQETGERT